MSISLERKEEVRQDGITKTYWTVVVLKSDNKYTEIYMSLSLDYQEDRYKKEPSNDWVLEVANKWIQKGDVIFDCTFHFDCYAVTPIGRKNSLKFLRNQKNKRLSYKKIR